MPTAFPRLSSPRAIAIAFTLCAALAACGNITSTTGGDAAADAPPTVAQACTDIDTSLCNALAGCSTFVLQLTFGDIAGCVSRNDLTCNAEQSAAGVRRTTGDLEACARALPAVSCADLIARKLPAACQDQPGTVINGA